MSCKSNLSFVENNLECLAKFDPNTKVFDYFSDSKSALYVTQVYILLIGKWVLK